MEAIGARDVATHRVAHVCTFNVVLVRDDNGFRKRVLIKKKDKEGTMKNTVVRERMRQWDVSPASMLTRWTIDGEKLCLASIKMTSGGIRLCTFEPKNLSCYFVDRINFCNNIQKKINAGVG